MFYIFKVAWVTCIVSLAVPSSDLKITFLEKKARVRVAKNHEIREGSQNLRKSCTSNLKIVTLIRYVKHYECSTNVCELQQSRYKRSYFRSKLFRNCCSIYWMKYETWHTIPNL